jgi:hypothetical protein
VEPKRAVARLFQYSARRPLGSDPQRLRELAAVAQATGDELEEAWARQRHPAGSGVTTV